MSRIVAIVGRPNVGKSRLFNRLARKRISIVHDQPGITRDVITAEIAEGKYTLLDTGGLGYKGVDTPAALTKASEQQVDFAIAAATLILFIVDGLSGLSSLDEKIAAMLGVQAAPQQQNDNRQLLAKIDRLEAIISQANDPSRLEEVITTRELRSEGQRLKDSEPLVKEIPEKRWDFFVNEGVEALGDKATVKAVFEYAVKAAIEADPALRAKTDAARKAAQVDVQKAEAAKRANGVNVTSTSTGKARPVSDDQAMEAVWAKHH